MSELLTPEDAVYIDAVVDCCYPGESWRQIRGHIEDVARHCKEAPLAKVRPDSEHLRDRLLTLPIDTTEVLRDNTEPRYLTEHDADSILALTEGARR